jgi:single-strand DNA-binding protein
MLKIQLIGNVGLDSEIRQVNGKKAITFNVAENQSFTNGKGEKISKTTWVSCTLWRDADQSTKLAEYLLKGTKVYVEGRPEFKTYTSNGETVVSINLTVIHLELLDSKKED